MATIKTTGGFARSFFSVPFILCAVSLSTAALALRPAMLALSRYYAKEPIPIRRPLAEFDVSALPTFETGWQFVRHPQPTDSLGTTEYAYIGIKRTQPAKTPSSADLVIAYYSNPQDKVPHVPDVCYRGQGAQIKKMTRISLEASTPAGRTIPFDARFMIFQWPGYNEVVMYCFCAEGHLRYSREQVRWIIGKPGNRRTYFSQIKAGVFYPLGGAPDQAVELCEKLLCEATSVLLAEYFPQKEQLKRR